MKYVYPAFYPEFSCLADRCRHNCCIGWEIDIDPETQNLYDQMDGPLGNRLRESICDGHFVLRADDRCPFLNDRGLCDLITAWGEDALCDICHDHPRFRHFFSDREEVGLGLCCEAAVDLLFRQPSPIELVSMGEETPTAEEEDFFALRERLLALAQNGSLPLAKRMARLLSLTGGTLPARDWRGIFLSLERLDDGWTNELQTLTLPADIPAGWEDAFEKLLWYFLYRHLRPEAVATTTALAVLSTQAVASLFAAGEQSPERLAELCRQYSAEIEYSDENTARLEGELCDLPC